MPSTVEIILGVAGAQGVVSALGSVQNGLTGLMASFGAAAGVQGALGFGLELEHLSTRTGQTVKDLVVLQCAFDVAGLGAESVGLYANMLQKSLSGVNEEGKTTTEVWKRLGLSMEQLRGQTFTQQLTTLAEAFSKLGTQEEKVFIARQLFGRAGGVMLQLIGDPAILKNSADKAGRLGDRMKQNATAFAAVREHLTVLNLRMKEMWVVAAEKLLPTLQSVAGIIKQMNLSPLGAAMPAAFNIAGLLGGGALLSSLMGKLNFAVMNWATNSGAAGNMFAEKMVFPLTAKLSGLLATVLPIGLAAAVAAQVVIGLYSAWTEWRNGIMQQAIAGFDKIGVINKDIGNVRTEDDRTKALEALKKLQIETRNAAFDEQTKWYQDEASERAVASYHEQLRLIQAKIDLLNTARIGEIAGVNRAADAEAARQVKEKEYAKWFESEEAKKLMAAVQEQDIAQRSNEANLAFARSVATQDAKAIAYINEEIAAKGATAERLAYLLKAEGERAKALKDIAELEKKVAQTKLEAAQSANEAAIRALELKASELEGDFAKTDAEKWGEKKANLETQIYLEGEYIKKLEEARKAAPDAGKGAYTSAINTAGGKLESLQSSHAGLGADPSSLGQQATAARTSFLSSLGTGAQSAATAITGTLNTALSSTSDLLYNVITRAKSFKDAWGAATLAIGQQFLHMVTDMVAKMIWRATVERALLALGTILHITSETTKTEATVAGGGIRLGVTLKSALADVYAGAVGAFRALVSIPYVGPILGAIAMAAALAGGLALVSKIGHAQGGLIAGPGGPTDDQVLVPVSNGEYVVRAAAVDRFGPDFFHGLNAGALNLASLPGNVARQASNSTSSGGGGGAAFGPTPSSPQQIHIGISPLDTHSQIQQWAESRSGRRYLANLQRGTVRQM